MRFRYQALTPDGQTVSGVVEMPSTLAAVEHLQLQGLLPIDATEIGFSQAFSIGVGAALSRALPNADLVLLCRQFSRLTQAGLPFDRALQVIAGLMQRRRSREAIEAVYVAVCDGDTLADAMAARNGAFPHVVLALVRAGEQGGIVAEVLARAADFLERAEVVRQGIVSALIYPAILGVVASIAIVIVLTVVLPEFEPIFQEAGAKLPVITQIVMEVGRVFRAAWWVVPGTALLLAGVWRRAMRHAWFRYGVAEAVLKAPVLGGLARRNDGARFARTLSALLANGVAAEVALGLSSSVVQNAIIAASLRTATEQLRRGEGLSGPLQRTAHLPDLLVQLARVGEEAGKLPELLAEAAGILEVEAQREVDRLLALLVPMLTIGMGGVIATIIAAVLLAMLSINDITG
jgi:general secretion pathway protein F